MSILGYSEQPENLIEQVNRNKINEEALLRALESIASRYSLDERWFSIARTHFEQGWMAFNRALMKPKRLTDDELKAGVLKMIGS